MSAIRVTHFILQSGQSGPYRDSYYIGKFFIERTNPMKIVPTNYATATGMSTIEWEPYDYPNASIDDIPYMIKGLLPSLVTVETRKSWADTTLDFVRAVPNMPGWIEYQAHAAYTD